MEKAITLHLKPDIAGGLESAASELGLSVEQYLVQLVERELFLNASHASAPEETGMVWENGLLVYRSGKPLPAHFITDEIQRARAERSERILGNRS